MEMQIMNRFIRLALATLLTGTTWAGSPEAGQTRLAPQGVLVATRAAPAAFRLDPRGAWLSHGSCKVSLWCKASGT